MLSLTRKRRNVTVFRHGAPEYCGPMLPAPVPTLTPDGAFSHSLVRRGSEAHRLSTRRSRCRRSQRANDCRCVTHNARQILQSRLWFQFDHSFIYMHYTHYVLTLLPAICRNNKYVDIFLTVQCCNGFSSFMVLYFYYKYNLIYSDIFLSSLFYCDRNLW